MAAGGNKAAGSKAEDVAAYVASMARELKAMAEPHDLKPLVYLLDMVRMEAEERAGDMGPLRGPSAGSA